MKERRKKDLQIRKEGEGENSEKLFKFPRVTFFDERVPLYSFQTGLWPI